MVPKKKEDKGLRWAVRILSAMLTIFSLFMFLSYRIEYSGEADSMEASSIMGLSVVGLGMLGLILAWKWELFGGVMALVCFVLIGIAEPMLFQVSFAYIYPACALMFIALWTKSRSRKSKDQLMTGT